MVCSSLDLFCLLCLCVFRLYKQKWRRLTTWDKARNWVFFTIQLVCSIDVIRAAIYYQYPYVNNLCRPWVCVIFFSSIRQNLKSVLYDFKDSIIVLMCIFLYVGYFAAIGYFIVEGTFQGYSDFNTIGNTYYSLIVLITTSNFPDIMLSAYNTSTWYTIFFVFFIIFGVFFLMNVLLAVIFDNYKRRVQWTSQNRGKERIEYIEKFFDKYDEGDKGYLTIYEAKAFFGYVLDFNYRESDDRKKLQTILKVADPEQAKMLLRHRVIEFFRMGGFIHLDFLGQEQKKLSNEEEFNEDDEIFDLIQEGLIMHAPYFGDNPPDCPQLVTSMDSNGSKRAKSRNSQKSLFTEQSSRFISQQPEWKLKGIAILQSTKYRLFIIIFNVLSISQFIGLLYLMKNFEFFNYIDSWIKYALAINSVFLIDLIAHIVMFGFKRVVKRKTEYLCELLLQIAA